MKATYLTYASKPLFSSVEFCIKHLLKICKEVQVSRKEIQRIRKALMCISIKLQI